MITSQHLQVSRVVLKVTLHEGGREGGREGGGGKVEIDRGKEKGGRGREGRD